MLSQKLSWIRSWLGITSNRDLYIQGIQIMTAIKDYSDQVNARFDEIDTSVDALKKTSAGIADDVAYLKENFGKIDTNPGPITPEDQALLDASLARLNSLSTRVREHKSSLDTIDTSTGRPGIPEEPDVPGEPTPEGRARAASQTRTATSNTPGASGYPKTYVVPPASGVTPPASAASKIPPSENVEARPEQTGGQASPAKANPNTPKANVPVNPAQNITGKPSAKPMP